MVYFLLIVGLVLLAVGGDMLVAGAVSVAKRLGVSTLLIGLTLVGFGTSTPELVTSLVAVFKGSGGIAIGNVIGSNIANILLVLGVAAIICPVQVDIKSFKRDAFFLGLSGLLLLAVVWIGRISFFSGAILTGLLIFYVVYSYRSEKIKSSADAEQDAVAVSQGSDKKSGFIAVFKAVGGIALTLLGAKLLVDNAIIIAHMFHISEAVIGLTIVAVGTSLPELATSVMSALKKENDVAFGNVVGSNIYNALFILGVTALLTPVVIPIGMMIDTLLMLGVTGLLIGIAFWKKSFSRCVGVGFLGLYAGYMWYLF